MSESHEFVFGTYEEEKEKLDHIPPDGVYDLELSSWTGSTAKSGKPLVRWVFEIINAENEEDNGYKVFHSTVADPEDRNASVFFFSTVVHLARNALNDCPGFDTQQIIDNDLPFFDDLIGETATASCKQDEYQGQKSLRIQRFI